MKMTNQTTTATAPTTAARNDKSSAEYAASLCGYHGRDQISDERMMAHVAEIRANQPDLAEYLNHPEITMGLAYGKFGCKGLVRRLSEMLAADTHDDMED